MKYSGNGRKLNHTVLMNVLFVVLLTLIAVIITPTMLSQNRTIVRSAGQRWMEVLTDGC